MNCPVCKIAMIERDFGGVVVHVCDNGCKGIWFDWLGLSKLDKNNEGLGQALQDALNSPRINDANRGQINCPKCNEPMHHHEYKHDKEVNIDECYDCGGIFLDPGELKQIRDHHLSEQEEDAYFQKLVNNVPGYQQALQDEETAKVREEALRHFAGFFGVRYKLGL
jgi:Zn-finger nucleic acid-binding protein